MPDRKIRDLDTLKQDLRARVDIVDFIGGYVDLAQRGRHYFGCCPFHAEDTPSFNVTPDKGLWSCFGCRESGDLFKFVERFHQCSFVEAISIIADRIQFPLDAYYRERTAEEQLYADLYSATRRLARILNQELTENDTWVDYFFERGITLGGLSEFLVGYCPSIGFLEGIVDASLLDAIEPNRENRIKLFDGHLVYPQFTPSGDIWGWYSRNEGKPKYHGPSSLSKLFQGKARLYGLHSARKITRGTDAGIILVEGFNDAIAAQQAGFPAVAICGTALSDDQIETLHAYSIRKATVVLDGDEGGRAGMMALALRANEVKDIDLKFVSIPGDPDEYLTVRGSQAFTEALDDGVYAIEYVIARQEDGDLSSASAQLDFLNRVRPFILSYPSSSIQRAIGAKILAERLSIDVASVHDFLDEGLAKNPLVSITGEAVLLAELMMGDSAFIRFPELREIDFSQTRHRNLFSLLSTIYHEGGILNPEIVTVEAMNRNASQSTLDLIHQLESTPRANVEYHYSDVRDKSLRRESISAIAKASVTVHDLKRPVQQILGDLTESVTSLVINPNKEQFISASESADRTSEIILARQTRGDDRRVEGLDLGDDWELLMAFTNGFRPRRVHLVCALSNVGKSVVGVGNWVHRLSIAEDGPRAWGAVFSMEMDTTENIERIAAIDSGVPSRLIQAGRFESAQQAELVMDSLAKIREAPHTWVENTVSVQDIAFKCRVLRAKGKLDYLVIDYLQLLDLSGYNSRWSKTEKYGQASQDIHNLAQDLDIPIIAMAQLNRKAYEDEVATGEDIGECFKFYQDAHVCYVLSSHGGSDSGRMIGFLDKNRGGPSKKTIELDFENSINYATLRVKERGMRGVQS